MDMSAIEPPRYFILLLLSGEKNRAVDRLLFLLVIGITIHSFHLYWRWLPFKTGALQKGDPVIPWVYQNLIAKYIGLQGFSF